MVATGEGLDDLKIHRILQDAMKEASASQDASRKAAAAAAGEYLKKIHTVWDADHTHDESLPYLGLAADWGYDQFYQDWQEQMARYAAACMGVKWVEPARRE
jgi:predicted kinase